MRRNLFAVVTVALLLLAATAVSFASGRDAARVNQRPPMSRAIHSALNFGIYFMPDVPVSKLDWDLELEYEVDDVRGVYNHYDQALKQLGFIRTSYNPGGRKIKARYSWPGITASLEVKLDKSRTEVELEIKGRASSEDGRAFRFDAFGGINFPFFYSPITEIEWEVDFRHASRDFESVFRYYDEGLTWQGWNRTEIKIDSSKIKAKYASGDQEIELKVDRKSDYVTVKFELE